jgi:ubiquitin-conjugating enzyme E2 variant
MVIAEIVIVVLLVDFVSGLVHWAEDTFWTETTPLLGKWIVKPNVLHHCDGSAFTRNTWLQSSWDLLAGGVLILGVAWLLHLLSWHVWVFVIVGINANQIHKWNHVSSKQVPTWARALQRICVLQSSAHHRRHHSDQKNSHYCVVTPALNPLLDRLGFWRTLDSLVPTSATPRRTDIVRRSGLHH